MLTRAVRLPFKFMGITLLVDWSFLIMLPLLAWMIGSRAPYFAHLFGIELPPRLATGVGAFLLGLAAAVGLFICIVLHEMGHAITAQAYGVEVQSITLWFLGGVARFEQMPRRRGAEALIAIAGPIDSFVIAGLCWVASWLVPVQWAATRFVLVYLSYVNVVLAVFNLIPAIPLDGGRVLRSVLALWLPFHRATQIAGGVSRVLAVLMAILGFLSGNFFLLIIAIFVFFAVSAETSMVHIEELLRDMSVRRLMYPNVSTISEVDRVADLSDAVWRERHTKFPVVNNDRKVQGVVSLEDSHGKDPSAPVTSIMHPPPTVPLDADATEAFRVMSRNGFGAALVIDSTGTLEGIITKTDLMRAMQTRELGPASPRFAGMPF